MSVGKKGIFIVQLSLQLLMLVFERLVCQQELVVQLGPLGRARLRRTSLSVIGEDSRRVIYYSTEVQLLDPNLGDWG